jgi:hypothetical protein
LDGLEDAGEVIDLLSDEEGEETPTHSLTQLELAEWLDTQNLRTLSSNLEEIVHVDHLIVDRGNLPRGVWYWIGGDFLRDTHLGNYLEDNPHIWALEIEGTRTFIKLDSEHFAMALDARYSISNIEHSGQDKVHVCDSQYTGIELTHYIESLRSLEWYNEWDMRSGVTWDTSKVVQWRMVATRKADGTYLLME